MSISRQRIDEIKAIPDENIDYSDIPELDERFWQNAKVTSPETKQRLTVQLDADVIAWFKQQGRDYQTRMNAVLRRFYEANKDQP